MSFSLQNYRLGSLLRKQKINVENLHNDNETSTGKNFKKVLTKMDILSYGIAGTIGV
jgi:hypothetical protein